MSWKDTNPKMLGFLSNWLNMNHKDELANFTMFTSTGQAFNAPLVGAERWLVEHTTKQEAMHFISEIKEGNGTMIWEHLKQIGLPIKNGTVCPTCGGEQIYGDCKNCNQ